MNDLQGRIINLLINHKMGQGKDFGTATEDAQLETDFYRFSDDSMECLRENGITEDDIADLIKQSK